MPNIALPTHHPTPEFSSGPIWHARPSFPGHVPARDPTLEGAGREGGRALSHSPKLPDATQTPQAPPLPTEQLSVLTPLPGAPLRWETSSLLKKGWHLLGLLAPNTCSKQRAQPQASGRDMAMDLLPQGRAESLSGSLPWSPERGGSQTKELTQRPLGDDKVKGLLRGGQKKKVMPLKHTKGPSWPRVGPVQYVPNIRTHPKHHPKAGCKFTDALTPQVFGKSTSLGLDSPLGTSRLICKDLLSTTGKQLRWRCQPGYSSPGWLAMALCSEGLRSRTSLVMSALTVGGQRGTAFSSLICQPRINPSCFTDGETEARGSR